MLCNVIIIILHGVLLECVNYTQAHTHTDQGMGPHTVDVDFISAENAIRYIYIAATYYYKTNLILKRQAVTAAEPK